MRKRNSFVQLMILSVIYVFATQTITYSQLSPSQIETTHWPIETLIAFESTSIGKQNYIHGDVVVIFPVTQVEKRIDQQLYVDEHTTINGSVTAPSVCLGQGAKVTGEVRAERFTCISERNNPRTPPLKFPLDIRLPPFPFIEPGRENILVKSSERLILAPGSYDEVVLERGSQKRPTFLILEGGIYEFDELRLGTLSHVECLKSCEIRIQGRLLTDSHSYLGYKIGSDMNADDLKNICWRF